MDSYMGIPIKPQESINQEKPGDYKNEDGLLVCGECGKHKQARVKLPASLGGREFVVACVCDCIEKELEEKKRQAEYEEEMARLKRLRIASLMADKFKLATFGAYTIREENKKAFRIAKNYVENFKQMEEENQGLVFYGTVGTGKSYTAACIANALLEKGVPVIMTSFVKILQDLHGGRMDESGYVNMLEQVRLLIIDDLGAERNTDFALEKVYNIIDSRVRVNKPLILTTNLTMSEMQENPDIRYRRIYDRIFENCYPVNMPGRSLRLNEAARRIERMKELVEG